MAKRILGRRELKEEKGVHHSNVQLLRLEAQQKFPKRIRVSENRIGWLEEEVDAWIDDRAAERGSVAAPKPASVPPTRLPRTAAPPPQTSVIEPA